MPSDTRKLSKPPRILIVDDDAGQRSLLTSFLQSQGFEIVTAESGGVTKRLNEQMGYTYDAAGNLNFRTNNALVQTFNNNSLNELTTVTRTGTLTVSGNTTTPATNVTVNGLTALRYADLTYARTNFPLVNATTNFTAIAQSPIGLTATNTVTVDLRATTTPVYDLNGNLRTNGNQILEYDDENQLVTNWVASAWKSEFTYDGQHRVRIARDYGWSGGAWVKTNEVRLIYDGVAVVQERDSGNAPLTSYTRSGSYLLSRTDNAMSSHAYYHTDGNRNVTTLINANQLIVARYVYDSYGNTLAMNGSLADANAYRFANQRFQPNSGLSLYLRRAYSPSLQRFVNRDPIEEAGGINLYGFVGNNPINRVDSLGLWNLWNPATWGVPNGVGWSLGNSLTPWHESAGWSGFSLQTTSEADAAFLDGLDPFGNPFAKMGLYDPCDKTLKWSKGIGTATFAVEGALAGGAAAFTARGTSIFYSGGQGAARAGALELEAAGEGSTIYSTVGGRILAAGGESTPQWLWKAGSWLYANTTGSSAIVVLGEGGGTAATTLGSVEAPVLAARGVTIFTW